MDVKKLAESMQDKVVMWRRDLHKIPEIGNYLPQTSKYVQDRLTEMGIPFVTMVNGSGVLATITGESLGKTIALRADMDALPLTEDAPVDFKSMNGKMHACGHDAHTAILLGAAKVLNDHKSGIKGTIKLIFQPGEEAPGGAKPMIAEGCLRDVDAIFGQHIGCLFANIKESGKILVSHNSAMACRDVFKIKIIGRGGHGAWPENCIDPITIAAQVINGINVIKAREIAALAPSVISICMVHGGTANNIIPQVVELEGSTRAVDQKTREKIAARIEQVLKSTCEAYGAAYEFKFSWDYDITVNNPEMADLVIKSVKDLGMGNDLLIQPNPLMGSEDMSFFLNEVPGAYYFLTSVVQQDGQVYGHHNTKFMLDESVFSKGVAVFLQITANYLGFE
ncbi:MAG: M20 family metallopeptidase [Defluviitaleaceae bacterium]|nr:M20 family metallopeptidase [Defluviitaleaceae bacterium]